MNNKLKQIMCVALIIFISVPAGFCVMEKVLLKTTSTWDKSEYKEIKMNKPEVTVLKIIIKPGEKLAMHKHDLVNVVYVEQGTLTVITDKGEECISKSGEVLPELIGKYHYGINKGDETVKLIVFYVGEKGTPLLVNKYEELTGSW